MGVYQSVGLDMVLRWAELAASTLFIALLAGVLLYITVVLHHTRSEAPRRRAALPAHAARGAGAAAQQASTPTH